MYVSDLKHTNASLEEKLRRLYTLKRAKKIDLSFRPPYLNLLQAFGNPHKKLPPVLHVAGTNGKGSIIATLQAILETSGYKVHAYTSPHLCTFNERITLAGQFIEDAALEELIDRALILNNGAEATFFEITTAIAFAAFSTAPADILLLETGMGGRLDCTNVIEHPIATIIGAIGMDHVEHLGDSLEKIAGEKAGIMKRGVSCVVGEQADKSATDVFETRGRELGVELFHAGAQWVSEAKNGQLHFVFNSGNESVERILPLPNLQGLHQVANAGAALAALEVIKDQFPVTNESRTRGLTTIRWPARLQNLTAAFRNVLPSGWEVWLDGAHNEDAAKVLSTQAQGWKQQDGKKLHLLIGMMKHKNPDSFLPPLLSFAESVSFINIPDEPNAHKASDLAKLVQHAKAFDTLEQALKSIAQGPKGRLLITGSLYLAGHVLNYCGAAAHNRDQETLTQSLTHAA